MYIFDEQRYSYRELSVGGVTDRVKSRVGNFLFVAILAQVMHFHSLPLIPHHAPRYDSGHAGAATVSVFLVVFYTQGTTIQT
jgi:hypothetical protein